jgi:hypothetical protein
MGSGILLAPLALRYALKAGGPDTVFYDSFASASTQQFEYPPEVLRSVSQQVFVPNLQIPFAAQSGSILTRFADPVAPPAGQLA